METHVNRRGLYLGGVFVAAVSFASLSAGLTAQQTLSDEVQIRGGPYFPPAATGTPITVKTQLVEVSVVVRDSRGRPVGGLAQNDFKVFDDGKERAISAFSLQTFKPATEAASTGRNSETTSATAPDSAAASNPTMVVNPVRPLRYVALYFDDEHTQPGDLARAEIAAKRFAKEALAPEDRIGVFTSSSEVSLDFTPDVPKIIAAIDGLKSHLRFSENGFGGCPRITPYQAYLISNNLDPAAFDAARTEAVKCNCSDVGNFTLNCARSQERVVKSAADQTWGQVRIISENSLATIRSVINYLAKFSGNRTLLLASSGFLAGTLETQQDKIVNDALHAGIVINALDAKGLYAEPPGRPFSSGPQDVLPGATFIFETRSVGDRLSTLDDPLANFATSTGGLFFRNRNDLDYGMREIGMVPEVSYLLGFSPDNVLPNGKYHKLRVTVGSMTHAFVQARPGYFAPAKDAKTKLVPAQPSPMLAIDREVSSSDKSSALAASIAVEAAKNEKGEPSVRVTLHMDVKELTFDHKNDRSLQTLTIVMALFSDEGAFITGEQGVMNLALTQTTLNRMNSSGINPKLLLHAAVGNYRLRVVAQETVTGKFYASSQSVEIK